MKAAIDAIERELKIVDVWANPANAAKAKEELTKALEVLKQVERNGGELVPRKKPKWI